VNSLFSAAVGHYGEKMAYSRENGFITLFRKRKREGRHFVSSEYPCSVMPGDLSLRRTSRN
jgi:hypothetical protein